MKRYESAIILPTGIPETPFCIAVPRFICEALGCGLAPGETEHKVWLRLGILPAKDMKKKKKETELKTGLHRLVVFPYHPRRPTVDWLLHITVRLASMPGTTFLATWFLEQLCQLRLLSTTAVDTDDEGTLLEAVYEVQKENWLYGDTSPNPDDLQTYAYYLRKYFSEKGVTVEELGRSEILMKSVRRASGKVKFRAGTKVSKTSLERAAKLWSDFIKYAKTRKDAKDQFSEASTYLLDRPFDLDDDSKCLIKHFGELPYSIGPIAFWLGEPEPTEEAVIIPPVFRIERCFNETETDVLNRSVFEEGMICNWNKSRRDLKRHLGISYLCLPIPKAFVRQLDKYLPSANQALSYAVIGRDITSGTFTVYFKPSSEIHRKVKVEVPTSPKSGRVSELASHLFRSGLNLRAISDQYSEVDNGVRHVYEFTANFEESNRALHLMDKRFARAFLERFKMPFLGPKKLKERIEITLPCGLPNSPNLLGITCSCVKDAQHCKKEEGKLCRESHGMLKSQGDLLLAEAFDDAGRCLAFRTTETGKFATAYLTGLGSRCDATIEQLGKRYRWSSPFATSIAAALSDVLHNINSVDMAEENTIREIAVKITERAVLRDDKKKARNEKWRELNTNFFQHPSDPTMSIQFEVNKGPDGRPKALSGGMSGKVYKIITNCDLTVDENNLGRDFALKKINPAAADGEILSLKPPEQDGFFMRGIRLGSTGRAHPWAVLMKYLPGRDLDRMMKERTHSPTLKQIFDWLIRSSRIVEKWSQELWIHWDIKPGNLFLTESDHLYLIDFGLATELNDKRESSANIDLGLKDKLNLFGRTTYHVAPEIKRGNVTTIMTPVYSLSTLICQLLGDPNALKPNGLPELPEWVIRTFSNESDVIKRGLAEKPQDRPTVNALKNVLQNCAAKVDTRHMDHLQSNGDSHDSR